MSRGEIKKMKTVQPIRDMEKLELIKQYLRKKSERDYALFLFGVNTGLRVSDMLKLRKKDVMGTHIDLKETKTRKAKRFPLNNGAKRGISKQIANLYSDDHFIFHQKNNKHKPISREYAYRVISRACEQAGVDNAGTHTMRKTFGYWHYKQNKDVAMLQKIFNHSSPSITLDYIGIVQDEIDTSYNNFEL